MTSHIAAHAVPGDDESIDLESVRLPILVGISAFADARQRNPGLQLCSLHDLRDVGFSDQGVPGLLVLRSWSCCAKI